MKLYIAVVGLLLFSSACLEKEKLQGDYAVDLGGIHCQNNLMDENELGTDCGGSCEPCTQNKAPCSLDPNTIYIGNESGDFESKNVISTSIDTLENGYMRCTASVSNSSNGIITFTFNQLIDLTKTYTGIELLPATGNFVDVEYTETGWDDREGNGTVYVYLDANGRYVIQSCNYEFEPLPSMSGDTQWFNVTIE